MFWVCVCERERQIVRCLGNWAEWRNKRGRTCELRKIIFGEQKLNIFVHRLSNKMENFQMMSTLACGFHDCFGARGVLVLLLFFKAFSCCCSNPQECRLP